MSFGNLLETIWNVFYKISTFDECIDNSWDIRTWLGLVIFPLFCLFCYQINPNFTPKQKKHWKIAFIIFPITAYVYVFKKEQSYIFKICAALSAVSTFFVVCGISLALMRHDGGCYYNMPQINLPQISMPK